MLVAVERPAPRRPLTAKTPARIVWNQGLYSIEGWGVPKGTPRAEEAKAFVRFCGDAKRQAAFTDDLAYGPTNLNAYAYIKPERAALAAHGPGQPQGHAPARPEMVAAESPGRDGTVQRVGHRLSAPGRVGP